MYCCTLCSTVDCAVCKSFKNVCQCSGCALGAGRVRGDEAQASLASQLRALGRVSRRCTGVCGGRSSGSSQQRRLRQLPLSWSRWPPAYPGLPRRTRSGPFPPLCCFWMRTVQYILCLELLENMHISVYICSYICSLYKIDVLYMCMFLRQVLLAVVNDLGTNWDLVTDVLQSITRLTVRPWVALPLCPLCWHLRLKSLRPLNGIGLGHMAS